jgi:hypothetical protein
MLHLLLNAQKFFLLLLVLCFVTLCLLIISFFNCISNFLFVLLFKKVCSCWRQGREEKVKDDQIRLAYCFWFWSVWEIRMSCFGAFLCSTVLSGWTIFYLLEIIQWLVWLEIRMCYFDARLYCCHISRNISSFVHTLASIIVRCNALLSF